MNNNRLARIVLRVNVARSISDHLLGQEHPMKHRMWVGSVLMTSGVLIAQIMSGSYIHFLFEGVGYMIHGTGLIPFVDWFSQERVRPAMEQAQQSTDGAESDKAKKEDEPLMMVEEGESEDA